MKTIVNVKGYGFLLRQANKFLDKPSGKAERERANGVREWPKAEYVGAALRPFFVTIC